MAGLGFEIKRRGPANATRRPSGKGSEIGGKRPAPQLEKRSPESLALAMPAINREEKFFFAPSRNRRCKSTNQRDRRWSNESRSNALPKSLVEHVLLQNRFALFGSLLRANHRRPSSVQTRIAAPSSAQSADRPIASGVVLTPFSAVAAPCLTPIQSAPP